MKYDHSKLTFGWHCSTPGPLTYGHRKLCIASTKNHNEHWPIARVNWPLDDIAEHRDQWPMATVNWPLNGITAQ